MANGASARGVLAMVLRQGLKLIGMASANIYPLAVVFDLALRSYLFETAPADPLMLAGVADSSSGRRSARLSRPRAARDSNQYDHGAASRLERDLRN